MPWPIRFRIEQMGDQLAMNEQHDPGEQQQYVGQRLGESPVSGRKDYCDVSQLGRNHFTEHDSQSGITRKPALNHIEINTQGVP